MERKILFLGNKRLVVTCKEGKWYVDLVSLGRQGSTNLTWIFADSETDLTLKVVSSPKWQLDDYLEVESGVWATIWKFNAEGGGRGQTR